MQRRDFLALLGAALLLPGEGQNMTGILQAFAAESRSIPAGIPIYEAQMKNEASLAELCAPFLTLSDAALSAIVPPQGGFLYSGCPNCQGGTGDNNITWNLALGEKVQCQFCNEVLPGDRYPENGQVEIKTPIGTTQVFKYHQSASGKKYWLSARRWFDQRTLLEKAAYNLAQLYRLDPVKYAAAGQKAGLILERFAEVYPQYVIKHEYPSQEKTFIASPGAIKDSTHLVGGPDYAGKWSAWGYTDVSVPLLLAYDQLAGSKLLVSGTREKIETALFGGMVDFVAQHGALPLNNMSPTLWRSQAIASQVLNRPEIASHILPQMRTLLQTQFTYDGFWKEGTVSYHQQTAGGFQNVLDALYPPLAGSAAAGQEYSAHIPPDIRRVLTAKEIFKLPNGRYATINDTWASDKFRGQAPDESKSHLMPGLGYAILGRGQKEQQSQAHLKFTGRFGHTHYDSLNLFLFAAGKELVSDIGYTHTKARPWATSTAAHSTVLVDEKNQTAGNTPQNALGNILLFNADDAGFQAAEATATEAYEGVVSEYKRALLTVQATDDLQYIVDLFHVAGGARHDWILHGSADHAQQVELVETQGEKLPLQPLKSLLPAGFEFVPPQREGDLGFIDNGAWALGHFRDIAQAPTNATVKATFRFTEDTQNATQNAGLQTWVLGAPGSTFITARSWSVRGAAEDQARLDDFLRTSLLVRRDEQQSRFIAVHVPFTGTVPALEVRQLPWTGAGVLLQIDHPAGSDYVLYQPEATKQTAVIAGKNVEFDGRVALVRVRGNQVHLKMIGGSRLTFGDQTLTNFAPSGRLLKVEKDALTVEGDFKVAAGNVIILHHGNERTSAFHVAETRAEGANTIIRTSEPAALAGNASGTLKMLFFPHLELPGPHHVTADLFAESTKPLP